MIKYALICSDCDHEFEGWFQSSSAYDEQSAKKSIYCPVCNSPETGKQIMAPAVSKSHTPEFRKAFKDFSKRAREHVAQNYDYVGESFADEARSMYYGETEHRPIWGETKPDEAKALAEEGVPAAPLPKPLTPPVPKPPEKLN